MNDGGCTLVFLHAGSVPVGAQPYRVAAGNLDGLGRADLVVTASGDSVRPFYSLADGGYLAGAPGIFAGRPEAMAVLDLDGDGRDDVVVGTKNAGNVAVFRSLPGLGFSAAVASSINSNASSVRGLVVGDFNKDGKSDLVAVGQFWTVRTLIGNGMGALALGALNGTLYTPSSVATADVSGDGILDLAVSTVPGFGSGLLFGDGDGGFVAAGNPTALNGADEVVLADVSGDGKADLITTKTSTVWVSTSSDGGFPSAPQGYDAGINPHFLAVSDFDADGRLDVATCNDGNEISVLRGAVPSPFGTGPRKSFPIRPFSGEAVAQHLTAVDLDGDGVKDLAVTNPYHSTVELLLARCQ